MTAHCKPDPTEYAPYHLYGEFWEGVAEYPTIVARSEALTSNQRAYDCGAEYAMRLARWVGNREVVR